MLKLPICLASVLTIILIADQSKALVDVQEKADSSFHGKVYSDKSISSSAVTTSFDSLLIFLYI